MHLVALFPAALLGALGWTLAEYVLHRWGAHAGPNKSQFRKHHLEHHGTGEFAPWTAKALAALPAVGAVFGVSVLAAGLALGAAFTLGFAAMYLTYEIVHRRIHTHAPRGGYTELIRRHHLHHHFHSAKTNHGVTTPVWDYVFGTAVQVKRVRAPRKLAPLWLTDDSDYPAFELRGKRVA